MKSQRRQKRNYKRKSKRRIYKRKTNKIYRRKSKRKSMKRYLRGGMEAATLSPEETALQELEQFLERKLVEVVDDLVFVLTRLSCGGVKCHGCDGFHCH